MKINQSILLPALLSFGLLTGCATAPDQEIESAYAALIAADSAEADLYAPELYRAAEDSFAAAQADIETQESLEGVSPDYSRARSMLVFAKETAEQATLVVPERKEAMKLETDSLIADARERLDVVREAASTKPAPTGAVNVVSLQDRTLTAQAALQQAVDAQANGIYAQAHELVRTAIQAIEEMEAQIAETPTQTTLSPRS